MRYLHRPFPPPSLKSLEKQLRDDLHALKKKYGSYDKIPDREKETLWQKLRSSSHIDLLKNMTGRKCSYCESMVEVCSYIEIDHFYPQSKYQTAAYSWKNLLPSCKQCNISKSALDTKLEPIINPSKVDPIKYISYNGVEPKPRDGLNPVDRAIAERTIRVLKLDRSALLRNKNQILISLHENIISIQERIDEYRMSATSRTRKSEIELALTQSLNVIKTLIDAPKPNSGWLKTLLIDSPSISSAITITKIDIFK